MELPAAAVGDLVVVFQPGAYGLSASPVGFLGHPVAREVLVGTALYASKSDATNTRVEK